MLSSCLSTYGINEVHSELHSEFIQNFQFLVQDIWYTLSILREKKEWWPSIYAYCIWLHRCTGHLCSSVGVMSEDVVAWPKMVMIAAVRCRTFFIKFCCIILPALSQLRLFEHIYFFFIFWVLLKLHPKFLMAKKL